VSSPFTPPESDFEIAPPSTVELLWENHRNTFLGGLAALLIISVIVLGVIIVKRSNRIDSENLFANATGEAGWREVITKYPHSPAAADALLLLASSLRNAGKLDESDSLYSHFAESFPQSPLAISGLLGRASNARVSGHPDRAASSYQQAAAGYPQSYGAPFALLMEARLMAQLGKIDETRRIIQSLASQYPTSFSAQAAGASSGLQRN